jgi:hypothetical protein
MFKREIRMTPTQSATRFVAILSLLAWVAVRECPAADRVILDRATIIVDSDEPTFARFGAEELAGYLKDTTGTDVSIAATSEGVKGVQILVGTKAARRIVADDLPDEKAGEEAYLVESLSKDGADFVVAAGATPRGTKAALSVLMKSIEAEGRSAFVPAALRIAGKPALGKRGMHFNGWAFNSPYSFRNWSEEEWHRYLDILALEGVNLFYLWPFIEIMPVPLSAEDQAYLEECRRVVDYAQQKHGMEVWIMQCTNRVAKDNCNVADPRKRPYWRPSQEDLNPGKPDDFRAIMASREAMYRIINNADGVCNIDSDPGYCPSSPLSDYVKALNGFRELLDRHNSHGKRAKLINWMWTGWGHPWEEGVSAEEHQRRTIRLLKTDLPEPWELIAGRGDLLSESRAENVLGKTVLLPYGAIEDEPSYPATNLHLDQIRQQFDDFAAKYPEFEGMMGNVQTPLLQFPHAYYFTSSMFDAEYRKKSEREVLLDLAGHLYPEHRELTADCYLALKESDPARIQALADRLNGLLSEGKLGRLGIFGRELFPDRGIVARILVLQLNFRAAGQRLTRNLTNSSSKSDCEKLVTDYFDAYLAWDTAHGWHQLWGWNSWPIGAPARTAGNLATRLGDRPAVEAFFAGVTQALSARYDTDPIDAACVGPLRAAVLASFPVATKAQKAKASASVVPKSDEYPPSAAVDGRLDTLYWPGALTESNSEWLQLTWDEPQSFEKVVVQFLQHPSMSGRSIHLQKEVSPGKWEDLATTKVPADGRATYATATFQLPTAATLDKIRIVNLLDVFEVEVY